MSCNQREIELPGLFYFCLVLVFQQITNKQKQKNMEAETVIRTGL